jgi:hypothetical protein
VTEIAGLVAFYPQSCQRLTSQTPGSDSLPTAPAADPTAPAKHPRHPPGGPKKLTRLSVSIPRRYELLLPLNRKQPRFYGKNRMSLKCLYVSRYEGRDKNAPDPKNTANTGENTAKTRDKTQRQPAPTASTARPPMTPPTWDRLPSLSFTFSSGSARKDRLLEALSNVMSIAGTESLIR